MSRNFFFRHFFSFFIDFLTSPFQSGFSQYSKTIPLFRLLTVFCVEDKSWDAVREMTDVKFSEGIIFIQQLIIFFNPGPINLCVNIIILLGINSNFLI